MPLLLRTRARHLPRSARQLLHPASSHAASARISVLFRAPQPARARPALRRHPHNGIPISIGARFSSINPIRPGPGHAAIGQRSLFTGRIDSFSVARHITQGRGLASRRRSRPALPPSGASRSTPPDPALVYLAEDALPRVRDRVSHLCRHRGLDLARLDLQVVTADRLRLDTERDQLALDQTVQRIRPALLLLDPLVRLHSLDENSASDISSLLAFLRAINRRYHLALILVHHMAKRSRRNLGQSLRGSSDLHAWTDSACYLVRRPDDRLQLTVEHRSAPAPDPLLLRLSGGGDQPLSLLVDSADAPPPPLPEAVRAALRSAGQPLSRTVLRQRLRVNNARLGVALQSLQQRGLAVRGPNGWHLPS